MTPQQFDQLYADSRSDKIKGLREITDISQRRMTALQLAQAGEIICPELDVDQSTRPSDFCTFMLNSGWAWRPSVGQANILAGPGIAFPGAPMYNPYAVPAGAWVVPDPSWPDAKLYSFFGVVPPHTDSPAQVAPPYVETTPGTFNPSMPYRLATMSGAAAAHAGVLVANQVWTEPDGRKYRLIQFPPPLMNPGGPASYEWMLLS